MTCTDCGRVGTRAFEATDTGIRCRNRPACSQRTATNRRRRRRAGRRTDVFADVRGSDGRVYIRGARGEHAVSPEAIDAEVLAVYRHVQCAALALALSERSGSPVALVRSSTSVGRMLRRESDGLLHRSEEMVNWMHAVVASPAGCLDIDGLRSAEEVCAVLQQEAPEFGPYRVEQLSPVAQAAWVREIHRYAPRSATEWALAWHYAGMVLANCARIIAGLRRSSGRTPEATS